MTAVQASDAARPGWQGRDVTVLDGPRSRAYLKSYVLYAKSRGTSDRQRGREARRHLGHAGGGPVSGFDYRLRAPEKLITVEDYRRRARQRLPRMVWHFVDGGADDR